MNRNCEIGDIIKCPRFRAIQLGDVYIDSLEVSSGNEWVVVDVQIRGGQSGRDPWPDGYFVHVKMLSGDTPYRGYSTLIFNQNECYRGYIAPSEIKLIEKSELVEGPVFRRIKV